MTQAFKTWLAGLVATATFVTVSFQWFDGPIALLIYNIFGGWRVSAELAARISKIPLATVIVFVICGLLALMGRRFSKWGAAIAMSAISLLATIIIKDQLKFAFGRTWPDTWGSGIVSFVRDNVYGFHFFQSGKSFESFPSGHAAATAAVLSVVWILFRSYVSSAQSVLSPWTSDLWLLTCILLVMSLQVVSWVFRQDYSRSPCGARASPQCEASRYTVRRKLQHTVNCTEPAQTLFRLLAGLSDCFSLLRRVTKA